MLLKLVRAADVYEQLSIKHSFSERSGVTAVNHQLKERKRHYNRTGDLKSAFAVGHLLSELVKAECSSAHNSVHALRVWMAAQHTNAQRACEELHKVINITSTLLSVYQKRCLLHQYTVFVVKSALIANVTAVSYCVLHIFIPTY
jgi:hypothetical protein